MWYIKDFSDLTTVELEQILRLRQSIFIIEQRSFFEDIDGSDSNATHIFNKRDDVIYAYARILVSNENVILGRLTVSIDKRGNGSGRVLLEKALNYIRDTWPQKNIEIVAMSYLKDFYSSYGFKSVSSQYVIDGHAHEDMILEV